MPGHSTSKQSHRNYFPIQLRKYHLTLIQAVSTTRHQKATKTKALLRTLYEPTNPHNVQPLHNHLPSKSTKTRAQQRDRSSAERRNKQEKRRKGDIWRGSRVPAEKMWPTIWPVLGTIASYYAHNKRQWGHAKVTLPARLAPLLPAQRGLTAGCTMHDRWWESERDGARIASHRVPIHARTPKRARVYVRHTVNVQHTAAHAHKGHADGYERVFPLHVVGTCSGFLRAWESSHVSRSTSQRCTSVRRNFGGCTPILLCWTRTENLNLVYGVRARFAARMGARRSYIQPFSRRGWRRGRRWTQCGSVSYTSTFRIRRRWTDGGAAVLLRWCGLLLTPSLPWFRVTPAWLSRLPYTTTGL